MQATLSLQRSANRTSIRSKRSVMSFGMILLALLTMSGMSVITFWQIWHTQRIFTGTSVAGIHIGGKTRAEAVVHVTKSLSSQAADQITLQYQTQQWTMPPQIIVDLGVFDAVNQAYLVGRGENRTLPAKMGEQLHSLWQRTDITPEAHIDEQALCAWLQTLAQDLNRAAQPPIRIGERAITGLPGVQVDEIATFNAVMGALRSAESRIVAVHAVEVPFAAETLAPETTTAKPAPLPPAGLILNDVESGLSLALDAAILASVDRSTLRTHVTNWAEQIHIPAQDARLQFNPTTAEISVLQPSRIGRQLNVEATLASIEQALSEGAARANLVVEAIHPAVDMNRTAEMGIRELVASGTTYFAGSSAARVQNIEVAAEKFEGLVIPPGGIFSFNQTVGDVSAANGFEDSLIIWGDRTAVGVGGGVCQVSTTVFRAAFSAGFSLVERYNHGYIVSWYGEPGMDATIYTPTVDFRFRNDNDTYLFIDPIVDLVNGTMTFNFYGTKPDRVVTIGEPVITNLQEPGEPIYQVDPSLAPGQQRQVEYAKQGMTVTVQRTITENGVTHTEELVSHYQPWQDLYLVGPGSETASTLP